MPKKEDGTATISVIVTQDEHTAVHQLGLDFRLKIKVLVIGAIRALIARGRPFQIESKLRGSALRAFQRDELLLDCELLLSAEGYGMDESAARLVQIRALLTYDDSEQDDESVDGSELAAEPAGPVDDHTQLLRQQGIGIEPAGKTKPPKKR